MGCILSVNIALVMRSDWKDFGFTGIDKRPVKDSILVRAPGPRGQGSGSGLEGDWVFDTSYHQGDDRAVYVYAREDLDYWEGELGRLLPNGVFGENLTTYGVDIENALLGERWRIGRDLLLEVVQPRRPCVTFHNWMPERTWIKRFRLHGVSGLFLRVIEPGELRVGDEIRVVSRPDHDVTTGLAFRALTREPSLQTKFARVENLSTDITEVNGWVARLPGLGDLLKKTRRELGLPEEGDPGAGRL